MRRETWTTASPPFTPCTPFAHVLSFLLAPMLCDLHSPVLGTAPLLFVTAGDSSPLCPPSDACSASTPYTTTTMGCSWLSENLGRPWPLSSGVGDPLVAILSSGFWPLFDQCASQQVSAHCRSDLHHLATLLGL